MQAYRVEALVKASLTRFEPRVLSRAQSRGSKEARLRHRTVDANPPSGSLEYGAVRHSYGIRRAQLAMRSRFGARKCSTTGARAPQADLSNKIRELFLMIDANGRPDYIACP